jgi:hypothetical protein
MNYFKIDLNLDFQTKSDLILDALTSTDYYYHNSTKSKAYTNLDFLPRQYDCVSNLFMLKPSMMSLLKIDPNKLVDWHTDAKSLKRQTVIIFPLTENYAPCTIETGDIPYMDCYAFNTQLKHKVQNNNQTRISLQLFYDMPIEELRRIHVVENGLVSV